MDIFEQALPAGLPAGMRNEKGDTLVGFSFFLFEVCLEFEKKREGVGGWSGSGRGKGEWLEDRMGWVGGSSLPRSLTSFTSSSPLFTHSIFRLTSPLQSLFRTLLLSTERLR